MSESRVPVNIAVLTVTDTRDESTDKSGKLLIERLKEAGHVLHEKCILPDDIYQLRAQVSQWIATDGVQAVVTTGGTGLTGRDGQRVTAAGNTGAGAGQTVEMVGGHFAVGNDDDMAAGQLGSGKAVGARQQVAAHDDIIGTVTQPDGQ